MSKYPDISHYDPVNDWAKVKRLCPFLISKSTQGTSYIDPTLSSFIKGCENNKIPYWLYVYLNKGNELDQAKFLVKTCKSKVGEYFVGYVIDVEDGNSAANVKKALDYITGLGVKTMIYTMYADYEKYKDVIKGRPSDCAWWEARYGLNTGIYNSKYPCHSGVDLHQFTDCGKCDGISGSIDLNRIVQKGESWYKTPAGENESTASKESVIYVLKDFIKDVQKATGAKVDGIAGSETLSKTVTVSATKNRKHAVVKPIQKRLNSLGYNCGTVDGIAGTLFTKSVKSFQKAKGCVIDGEITAKKKTWMKLLGMD